MEFQKPPINTGNVNYKLRDLLDILKREIALETNCHAIATIVSFDSAKQTCRASIAYTMSKIEADAQGNPQLKLFPYPVLVDVPVWFPRGGSAGITFPVQPGDTCEIHFNDRDISNWFVSGQGSGPCATQRAHDLSDGIAYVGISSAANPIASFDTARASLFYGTTRVAVGASKVLLENTGNGKLGTSFTAFFTALQTFMSACAADATNPAIQAAANAFITAMTVPVLPTAHGPITNIEGILE